MFKQLKSSLVNRELRTVSQDFVIVVCRFKVSVYVHYVSTLEFEGCLTVHLPHEIR